MQSRLAPLVLAVALAAGCRSDPHDRAGGEHASAGHGASGMSGGGAALRPEAELAFLFPDGDDRGWAKVQNGKGHATAPPVPLSRLPAETRAELIRQLALTADVVRKFPTVRDAEAAGYRRAGPFIPGLGTHFVGGGRTIRGAKPTDEEILHPQSLIYDGLSPESPIAGLMYGYEQPVAGGAAEQPEGFAGPNDHWHYHESLCMVADSSGAMNNLGEKAGRSAASCAARGGTLQMSVTPHVLHVWTVPAYTNPLGVFAHANPAITCPDGTYNVGGKDLVNRCAPR